MTSRNVLNRTNTPASNNNCIEIHILFSKGFLVLIPPVPLNGLLGSIRDLNTR